MSEMGHAADMIARAREIRARLMTPPNGRISSELDIIPERQHLRRVPPAKIMPVTFIAPPVPISDSRPDLKVRDVVRAVSAFYGIPVGDLLAHRRDHHTLYPRQVAMFLAKAMTLQSFPGIAREFAGRDHTTILHACNKIGTLRREEERVHDDTQKICISLLMTFNVPAIDTEGRDIQNAATEALSYQRREAVINQPNKCWPRERVIALIEVSRQAKRIKEMMQLMSERGYEVTYNAVKNKLKKLRQFGHIEPKPRRTQCHS